MDDLVETLVTGLVVSLLLIFIAWWFWKRFDRPSEAQIEREESIARKKEETRMWRAVEAQMAEERAELEQKALFERRKAEERARALPPPVSEVSNAFAAFGSQQPSAESSQNETVEPAEFELDVDDSDVLDTPELVEVRQDKGVVVDEGQPIPEILIEDEPVQESLNPETEVPSAPDLDVLVEAEHEPEMPTTWADEEEIEPEETDWSDNWFANLEQH